MVVPEPVVREVPVFKPPEEPKIRFTDEQLQRYMDKRIDENLQKRMHDHRAVVKSELAKYRKNNLA